VKRFLLLLPLLLAACRGPEVYLAPGVPFKLRPAGDAPAFFVNQEVVFRLPDGRMETALAALENKDGQLSIVAGTPLGQTLMVITLKGSEAKADVRIPLPGDLDPRTLAGLVQFCAWPAESVRAGLPEGCELKEEGPRRILLRKGRPVWTALREGDGPPYREILLENPSLRLSVKIRTLEE